MLYHLAFYDLKVPTEIAVCLFVVLYKYVGDFEMATENSTITLGVGTVLEGFFIYMDDINNVEWK